MSADPTRAYGSEILDDLLRRRAGFVPTFTPQEGGPGHALLRIAATEMGAVRDRLDLAPTKRGFALLDLVGVGLVPAQAARAPVVFEPAPGVGHITAHKGTKVGATIPGGSAPLVFETEAAIAIADARIAEIASVVPGRDAYTIHTGDLAAGRPTTLFTAETQFAHELYLAHPTAFAFTGRTTVEIDLDLRVVASTALRLETSWWDGKAWRSFAAFGDAGDDEDSFDGTQGLTAGGTIRLFSPCAESVEVAVQGVTSHWIRLAVLDPLTVAAPAAVPEVARLAVRTITERRQVSQRTREDISLPGTSRLSVWTPDGDPAQGIAVTVRDLVTGLESRVATANGAATLPASAGATVSLRLGPAVPALPVQPYPADFLPPITLPGAPLSIDLALQRGLVPEKGISDGKTLNLTKAFQPLGPSPTAGAAFYLACADVFSKPGAEVTLVLDRPRTAQEEADDEGSVYEVQVNAARNLVNQIIASLNGIASSLDGLRSATGPLGKPLPELVKAGWSTEAWYSEVRTALRDAINTLRDVAIADLDNLLNLAFDIIGGLLGSNDAKRLEAERRVAGSAIRIALALEKLGPGPLVVVLRTHRVLLQTAVLGTDRTLIRNARSLLQNEISNVANNPAAFLPGTIPNFLAMKPEDFVTEINTRVQMASQAVLQAANSLRALVQQLMAFNPANLVAASTGTTPSLSEARVAWEYWNGSRWIALRAAQAGKTAANLRASGTVTFTVPPDWEANDLDGDTRRWLRARLVSGNFARLRLVAWTDTKSNVVNFLPVVEPRPPMVDRVEVYFRYASATERPQRAIGFSDFTWVDHTPALAWPGPGFVPFTACRDDAPALYLGFDAPLPAEQVGLWLGLEERPEASPSSLRFEAWDGAAFRPLAAGDQTRGLTRSGLVLLPWPGDAGGEATQVVRAQDTSILLASDGAGLRYSPGSQLWLSDERGGELVDVDATSARDLMLARAVNRTYSGGTLRSAPPARFGTPRTWLRLRLDADAEPPEVVATEVAPNAVMAANVETVVNEVLGGSDGTPGQVFFIRRKPVLGDVSVEVMELEGARASVDGPILEAELQAAGRSDDYRPHRDESTGRVDRVWVRWHVKDTLAFSSPGDRDCTIDRVGGRLFFGDTRFGLVPPAGIDNVRVTYQAGGDAKGNVAADAIKSVLSGVLARSVRSAAPAQGGADGETMERLERRGPTVLRHRHQALTAADYEELAREASAAVARARAIGATDAAGRPVAGKVRVVVVPAGAEPAPTPSPELRRAVTDYILARSPATLGGGLAVVGPRYEEIGVDVTVRPVQPDDSADVRERVRARIARFLRPLDGGPDGTGFDFGSRLAASDLAAALGAVPGVDAVVALAFRVESVPQGEQVRLEPDRLPTCGAIRLSLTEDE